MTAIKLVPNVATPQERVSNLAATAIAAGNSNPAAYRAAEDVTPKLAPISQSMFDAHARYLKDQFVWKNDGICLGRATMGAMHINRVQGIGSSPANDTFAGALAILKSADSKSIEEANWRFHAGLVVQPQGAREPWIIDYLTADPMPISSWAKAYDVPLDKVDIRSPYASWDDGNGSAPYKWMEDSLNATLTKTQNGTFVEND